MKLPTLFAITTSSVLTLSLQIATAENIQPADLVLTDGKIVTNDDRQPQAEAVAIHGDRIESVGSAREIARYIGPNTQIIHLEGKLAIPGINDSHGHFLALGRSKMVLDLSTATDWPDIVEKVAAATRDLPTGEWIVGRGWHQAKWLRKPTDGIEGYPTHTALSRRTPDHPVLLTHGTGHMSIVNARTMAMAGLDQDTVAPAGGEILRFPDGSPTGTLRENAMNLAQRLFAHHQRQRTDQQKRDELIMAIRLAADECLRYGLTSFQDAASTFADIDLFRELAEAGDLPVRLSVMVSEGNGMLRRKLADYRMIGVGNHHLTVRAIKRFADGALGTHGAWMLQPYNDLPTSRGLQTLPIETLTQTCALAIEHDFQMCVHAIGDRANREVLDVFESTFNRHPDRAGRANSTNRSGDYDCRRESAVPNQPAVVV
jgi:hypothetical protein